MEEKDKVSIRKGDLECRYYYSEFSGAFTAEFVKWEENEKGKESCYTIAFWEYDDHENCWDMRTIGSRFFDLLEEDSYIITKLCGAFQKVLSAKLFPFEDD